MAIVATATRAVANNVYNIAAAAGAAADDDDSTAR